MGKNCEVDVDACALASSTCPPQTECVDLPHSLQYTCRVPCPLNLQVGSNHERNLRVNISFVIITQPSFHASTRFVPNFHLKNMLKKNARCQDKISRLARLRRGSNITSAACLQSMQPSIVGLEQARWETSLVQTHYPVTQQTHPKADFTPCSWPTCGSGPISFQLLNLDHPNWMFTQPPPEFYLPFMIIFSLESDGWEWD